MSGSFVGLLIMTLLFRPACRNKEIKKRGESYSRCSGKHCEGYKQKTRGKRQWGGEELRVGAGNAEVSKIVWKRNGGVPRIFLNMLNIKGSVSFHQFFETHPFVKR